MEAVSDPDMMLVHVVAPKAEEARAEPRRQLRRRDTGRARSHQEGQDGQGRGEGLKLVVGLGNPGRGMPGRGTTSGSRWSTSWRGGRRAVRLGAGQRARGACQVAIGSGAARQAADVHEPERRGGRRARRYYKIETADLLVVVDDVQLPLGRLRGPRIGRRAQRVEVGHAAPRDRRIRAAADRRRTRETMRDLADHVLARFDADERDVVAEMIDRAADAAGCSPGTESRR